MIGWFISIYSSHSSVDLDLRQKLGTYVTSFLSQCSFIDGFTPPLPPMDILLLSWVTLRQCRIKLALSPISLVLSTSKLRSSLGCIHKFWPVSHSHTGDSTDGSWVLHSLHCLGYATLPLWTAFPLLPSGNIRRTIHTTVLGGTSAKVPSTLSVDSLDTLYLLSVKHHSYLVPSVFMKSGFCTHSLSLSELFALWDLPQSLFKSLTRPQRVFLWKWNNIPPRVWGCLLRLFLSCKNETVGI